MEMATFVSNYTPQVINQQLLSFVNNEINLLKKPSKKSLRQTIFEKDVVTSKKRPSVLLVEDSPIVQVAHRAMLKSIGCRVDVARNGAEALQLSENKYDIIFMDVGLPDISGIEVTAKIRGRDSNNKNSVPIVALTTHEESDIHKQCLEAGMNKVEMKPISLDKLKKIISDV